MVVVLQEFMYMTQVFISHSSEDEEFAHRLSEDLIAAGVQVWFAPESILPGERWFRALEHGITTSTHLLLVMSPDAVESEGVEFEMDLAIQLEWEGKITIIPLDYRACAAAPRSWRRYQAIKGFARDYDRAFSQLLPLIGKRIEEPLDKLSPMSNEELDDLLIKAIKRCLVGHSPNTKRTYANQLKSFIDWRDSREPGPLVSQLEQYVAHLHTEDLAPRTIRMHVNTIKRMIRTAADLDKRLATDVLQLGHVEMPKVPDKEHGRRLSLKEAQTLIGTPGTDTPKGLRDTCILALMAVAGLRRSEVASLCWGHLQELQGHNVIQVPTSGSSLGRTIKLPPWLADRIKEWGIQAGLDTSNPAEPVFCAITKGGVIKIERGNITPGAVGQLVQHYVDWAGLPSVTPNDLRRTSASLALEGGASVAQVHLLLGITSRPTTAYRPSKTLSLEDNAVDYNPLKDPGKVSW
jgi:site-specific recombinase XerD